MNFIEKRGEGKGIQQRVGKYTAGAKPEPPKGLQGSKANSTFRPDP